jgi:O-acetyl-ADP-ribose deacetylase (regulator of RNase III)
VITYVCGDLFLSPAQVLVNTVNTVGVMGKGVAKEFKRLYPQMFQEYRSLCERRQFNVGQLLLFKTPAQVDSEFPYKARLATPIKTGVH